MSTITSATISFVSEYTPGPSYDAFASATIGTVAYFFNGQVVLWDSSTWSKTTRTTNVYNPASTIASLLAGDMRVLLYISGALFGDTDPPCILNIYQCWIDVVYDDGTLGRLHPSVADYVPGSTGTVLNAGYAVDSDISNYASIQRGHFSSVGTSPFLALSGWELTTRSQVLAIPHGVNCHSYNNNGYFSPAFPPGNGTLLGDMAPVRSWCRANGIHGAINQDTQRSAIDLLTELIKVGNCAPVYSGDVLNLIPWDEVSAAGNGAIYIAPTTPVFDLADEDFVNVDGQAPVQSKRQRHANCDNVVAVQYINRTVDYADDGVSAADACSIALYGTRKGGTLDSSAAGVGVPSGVQQFRTIHDPVVARKTASILVKVSSADIWKHNFTLKAERFPVEAMDVGVISDSRMGHVKRPIRMLSVKENSDKTIACEAEDFIYGLHHPDEVGGMNPTGTLVTSNVDPGIVNTPIIFEPNQAMLGTGQSAEIWFVVSGSDQNYGGCVPYVSIDNGASYSAMGPSISPGITGVLTADYPVGSDPDTSHSLTVDLTESRGSLTGQTQATADFFLDQCYVADSGGYEVVCPTTAVLSSQYNYSLGTYVRRGVKSTTIADHPSTSRFAVLNSAVFRIPLDPQWVGKTLHFKFAAYNLQRGQQNSLANCVDYTYTPVGNVVPVQQYYGNATATVTGATNTITLGSTPQANSAMVFANGSQVPYTISGSVITLATTVFTGTITVTWTTSNPTPGGITLSYIGTANPQVRGSGIQTAAAASFTVNWPSGTQAGDLAIIFGESGYYFTVPNGWTSLNNRVGNTCNGVACCRILTADDITTGFVNITASGSYNGAIAIVTFQGRTAGVRETVGDSFGSTTPRTLSTSSAVVSTDTLVYFGSSRTNGTTTVNRGTQLRTINDGSAANASLYTEAMTGSGTQSVQFAYTGSITGGTYEVVVVVKGL